MVIAEIINAAKKTTMKVIRLGKKTGERYFFPGVVLISNVSLSFNKVTPAFQKSVDISAYQIRFLQEAFVKVNFYRISDLVARIFRA